MAASSNPRRFGVSRACEAGVLAGIIVLAAAVGQKTEAHKGITSKYTYNEHVFPILRDRCGSCHYLGGPAPMSLVDYLEAVPWSESMREALIAQKMPPWYADPMGPAVKGGHHLSTRELDVIMTWVVGGTPRADEKTFIFGAVQGLETPSYAGPPRQWASGTPDLTVDLPEHTLGPGNLEEEKEFIVETGFKQDTWIAAVDLLPGERSMVRDAVISVENGPVLTAWMPAGEAIPAPSGTAFRLPAGAKLHVLMHYKKNWQDEQNPKSDRSTIGFYTADAPLSGRSLEGITLSDPNGETTPSAPRSFAGDLKTAARVVAFRPTFDQPYEAVKVEAVLPQGRRATLLQLKAPQPQFQQRYWLAEPVELPAGTRIEVSAVPAQPDDFAIPAPKRFPLQLGVDFVSQ
jgi:hypothetical protein